MELRILRREILLYLSYHSLSSNELTVFMTAFLLHLKCGHIEKRGRVPPVVGASLIWMQGSSANGYDGCPPGPTRGSIGVSVERQSINFKKLSENLDLS